MTSLVAFLALWTLTTFGMTYIATRAEIADPIRLRLVAWKPVLALVLSCRACSAFWTGQAAAAATMAVLHGLGTSWPWHAWLYLPPVSGIAAVGMIDLIAFAKHDEMPWPEPPPPSDPEPIVTPPPAAPPAPLPAHENGGTGDAT